MNLIVFIIIISLLTSLYVLYPLVRKYLLNSKIDYELSDTDPDYKFLIREKDQLLNEIKDIDLDFGLEKLNEHDYQELRQKYRNKAAGVIKEIEIYEKLHNLKLDPVSSQNIDDEIEKIKSKK